jgi:hypothetical protein
MFTCTNTDFVALPTRAHSDFAGFALSAADRGAGWVQIDEVEEIQGG